MLANSTSYNYGGREGHYPWYTSTPTREHFFRRSFSDARAPLPTFILPRHTFSDSSIPLPTFVFPTRVSRCVNLSRSVKPSPDVRFLTRETFETVSICDSYWSFNAFSQHVKSSNMRSRLVKHSNVPQRVHSYKHSFKVPLNCVGVRWGI